MTVEGNGASSSTPSLSNSIQRVSPVARGYSVNGNVIIAVSCPGYFRSNARRAWRNRKIFSGLEASEGYSAGESRLGTMAR